MKSKIIHAYVGKPEFYMSKGQEWEWDPDDWPPVKVRISIDAMEEKGGDE